MDCYVAALPPNLFFCASAIPEFNFRPVRLTCFRFLAACVCGLSRASAASFEERVEALFRTPLDEQISLSPDGQRVAYMLESGRNVSIVIMNLEHAAPKRTVRVEPSDDFAASEEGRPNRLRFLRWATDTRLVFAPAERIVPLPPVAVGDGRVEPNPNGPTIISPIETVDVDGKERGRLVDARDFMDTPADARKTLADLLRTPQELVTVKNEPVGWRMPHLDILGFLPRDREQLIIRTRGGYSIPAQHLVDIRTRSVREFGGEWPSAEGGPEVFDGFRLKVVGQRLDTVHPTTAWQDEELARVQRELDLKFPGRTVEILDWSETRGRVLFRVTGGGDSGRVFVYQRPEDLVLEILRRAPWLNAAPLGSTQFFEFVAPDGAQLSGYVTSPRRPRQSPTPVVVVFPNGFPGRAQRAFDPEAHVLADLGYTVIRLNHRSVGGVRREDLNALRGAVDRVAVDDARTVLERLAALHPDRPVDGNRVVALGRDFGGYLAVRALQLQPDIFRAGIAINAPVELRPWLRSPAAVIGARVPISPSAVPAGLIDYPGANWRKLSVLENVEALTRPVLLLVEPSKSPAIDSAHVELRSRLERLGRTGEYVELEAGFAAARPSALAAVYQKIGDFLDRHSPSAENGPSGVGKERP